MVVFGIYGFLFLVFRGRRVAGGGSEEDLFEGEADDGAGLEAGIHQPAERQSG
jgi:hypothetical protein